MYIVDIINKDDSPRTSHARDHSVREFWRSEMRWVKMNLNNNQSYHTNHKLDDLAYQDTTFVMTADIHKVNREVNHSTHIMVTG